MLQSGVANVRQSENQGYIEEAKLGPQVTETGWVVYLGVRENNPGKANPQVRAAQGHPCHSDL